jgi:hypothetical protein
MEYRGDSEYLLCAGRSSQAMRVAALIEKIVAEIE